MGSTVTDSSGTPENATAREAGPVREWTRGEEGTGAGAVPAVDGEGRTGGPGPDAWPASGPVRETRAPDPATDLVLDLDLVPGEGGGGSAFGATTASVSVAAPGREDSVDAAPPERAHGEPSGQAAPVPFGELPADLDGDLHGVTYDPEIIGAVPAPAVPPSLWADLDAMEPAGAQARPALFDVEAPEAGMVRAAYGPQMATYDGARDTAGPEPRPAPEAVASVPGPAVAPEPPLPPADEDRGDAGDEEERTPRSAAPAAVFASLPVKGGDDTERAGAPWDTGRHQAVIANERTATIPVHLLFRADPGQGDAAEVPGSAVRRLDGNRPGGRARQPLPGQVRPSTRPAPVADPRLRERPGPALPGWVAVSTALGGLATVGAVLWWIGALPATALGRLGIGPRPYEGVGAGVGAGLALLLVLVLFALGGLSRGRVGYAWVLTLFGEYRGSVRRTGLMWVSPLLLRRRADVRLRHWRSEPLPAVDANGTALRVVVLVVWRIADTARAVLGIEDHEEYLREQVEAAMARVLSQLPADAFHEDAHTLRNAEAVGDALTRMLKADCEPVGIEVYSAQPTALEYAPEVAAAMQRRRIAAIDAKHRDSVLTSVVDAVDDTVNRLTARGIVELDDYERKSLVKDLTVAFYTGRRAGEGF